MGDCLYSLPAVRKLCQKHGCKADFYTSKWCKGLVPLLKRQSYIARVIIPDGYEGFSRIGINPVDMPIPKESYEAVYQLGFRSMPDTFLADYICRSCGLDKQPLLIDYDRVDIIGNYLTLDGKASKMHPKIVSRVLSRMDSLKVVDVGTPTIPADRVPGIIDGSLGFLGVPSFPLAVATFISGIRRVVLYTPRTVLWHLHRGPDDMIITVGGDPDKDSLRAVQFLSYGHIS